MTWGAPAMALMTVGAGTLILGRSMIGPAAVGIDWALWLAGTALGLATAVWIPYLMMTRHDIGSGDAFGGWLMPVVPPMVSAANGALLIPHVASAQGRLTLLLACYGMFGISLFALTWWSFTFPVGTCVTGTIGLAARSHADVLRGALSSSCWGTAGAAAWTWGSGRGGGVPGQAIAAISRALSV
jgi:tellurite resistance protein TehA-like permease